MLDYYLNEKKFADVAPPKGSVSLRDAASLQLHNPDRKNQFCVEMSDGGMCFFETRADTESHQWMSCLNAVLFGKGTNGGQFQGLALCRVMYGVSYGTVDSLSRIYYMPLVESFTNSTGIREPWTLVYIAYFNFQ